MVPQGHPGDGTLGDPLGGVHGLADLAATDRLGAGSARDLERLTRVSARGLIEGLGA